MNRQLSRARAVALLGASCAALPQRLLAQSEPPIRIAAGLADSYAEPFFALDGGFFARAGLTIDLQILTNGAMTAQAMAGGAVDVGIGDPINVAHPVNAGVPLTFLAGGGLYRTESPTTLLCVAQNSPLRTAKDLEGQVIATIALASISSLGLHEWLRQNGADLDKIRFIEMPFSAMEPAVERGTVAAALLSEPFISATRTQLRVLGKAFDAIGKHFYITTWFTTRDWIAKNPQTARRLVRVVYETARWVNAHHAESAPILAKYTKLDPERINAITRVSFGTSLEPGLLQPVLDVAYRYNQLEKPVNAADLIARL